MKIPREPSTNDGGERLVLQLIKRGGMSGDKAQHPMILEDRS